MSVVARSRISVIEARRRPYSETGHTQSECCGRLRKATFPRQTLVRQGILDIKKNIYIKKKRGKEKRGEKEKTFRALAWIIGAKKS